MSAYITPPSGWVDLRSVAANPVTIATGLGLGLHSYTHDVAINDAVNASNTADLQPEGLRLMNRLVGFDGAVALVHKAACSLAMAPIIDIVFRFNGGVMEVGIASEIVCEDGSVVPMNQNMNLGIQVTTGSQLLVKRFVGTTIAWTAGVDGAWYRYTITPNGPQVIHKRTTLPSGDPADWDDTGTDVRTYTDATIPLVGGNVITPFFGARLGTDDCYIAAVRMTPRRSV